MTPRLNTRSIRVVWIVAVLLTLLAATESALVTGRPLIIGVVLVALTMIKVVLVLGEYMEIRHAPSWLIAAALSWDALTTAVLVAATVYIA